MEQEPKTKSLTVSIMLEHAAISFALYTVLTDFVNIINPNKFCIGNEQFPFVSLEPDIIIADFAGYPEVFDVDASGYCKSPFSPRLISFAPAALGLSSYFRFRRRGISVCLWADGLQSVVRNVEAVAKANASSNERTIYDPQREVFFEYGGAQVIDADPMVKRLFPRLNFDDDTLQRELHLSYDVLGSLKVQAFKLLEVDTLPDAIFKLDKLGIRQFAAEKNALELPMLEDEALGFIAKWTTKQMNALKQ